MLTVLLDEALVNHLIDDFDGSIALRKLLLHLPHSFLELVEGLNLLLVLPLLDDGLVFLLPDLLLGSLSLGGGLKQIRANTLLF